MPTSQSKDSAALLAMCLTLHSGNRHRDQRWYETATIADTHLVVYRHPPPHGVSDVYRPRIRVCGKWHVATRALCALA